MKRISLFMFLIFSVIFTNIMQGQNSAWATGYRVAAAKKQIYDNNQITYSGAIPDYGSGPDANNVATVTRSVWKFVIPNVIPSDAEIYLIKITYGTNTTTGGFNTYKVSEILYNAPSQQLYEHAQSGTYIDFYSASQSSTTEDMPSSFAQQVTNELALNNRNIFLGITSGVEYGLTSNGTLSPFQLDFYYHRAVNITVKNNFNAGQIKVNGAIVNNGSTVNTHETKTLTFEAIEPQSNSGSNYLWNDDEGTANKSKWERIKGTSTIDKGSTQSISPVAIYDDNGAEFVANMRPFYITTFQNTGRLISINGSNYTSTGTVNIVDQNSVTATTTNNFSQNNVDFTFQYWKEGTDTYGTTFNPTKSGTYTAVYRAKPSNSGENPHVTSSVGQAITIAWTDNPNTNVTQYQIWRTVKHDGVVGPEELLATVGRGVQTYTDHEYQRTSTYVDLLHYDVRSYYNSTDPYIIGDYADEYWFAAYGQMLARPNQDPLVQEITGELPTKYAITNYPNPFNPTTTIKYQLPEVGMVTLKVYDILGKEVAELVNETKAAGYYEVNFDASKLTSGVYIYTIRAGKYVESKKMILTK